MIQVSVIIINYNTAQWVEACIHSMKKYTQDVSYEIWVVDNQSAERTIENVVAGFEELNYLQMSKNVGFGAACNAAAAKANGDFFLFLNPDTKLLNNAIGKFYDFWRNNAQRLSIACLGAHLQDEKGNAIHSFGQFPQMSFLVKEKLKSTAAHFLPKQRATTQELIFKLNDYQKVDYVTGADLFISRENFEAANGFDHRFFMYFEETDLQWRLSQAGKFAFVIKGPIIQHTQGSSMKGNTPLMRVFYFNSLLLYFKIHQPAWQFLSFKFLWCILDAKTLFQKFSLSFKSKAH